MAGQTFIDISSLYAGAYMLTVKADELLQTINFIKQ